MSQSYTSRQRTVTAVQWNGHNLAEINAFIEPIVANEGIRHSLLFAGNTANQGDFIIKEDNDLYSLRADLFAREFEPVE